MQTGRGHHTETLLANGKVLMAGGATRDKLCLGGITSAELYDPSTKSFTKTGSLSARRYAHTATALLDGKVLVAGGFGSGFDCEDVGEAPQSSAELYNPSTGTFQTTRGMAVARSGHTATRLPDGKVLIIGGGDEGGGTLPFFGSGAVSAEMYDPTVAAFTSTGSMATARFGHTATLLANGKVLVVGGFASYSSEPTATAEIYDPTTGHFGPTGKMMTPRAGHTATRLVDGRILITGGFNTTLINGELGVSATAELYNPDTGSFSSTGQMALTRNGHTATLLPNGTVLVAGGGSPTAEVYDPSTGLFFPTSSMETARTGHSATLLPNGTVLVAGGAAFIPLASAELYQ
jgi:N-acetylneuraminic acid mutarotase